MGPHGAMAHIPECCTACTHAYDGMLSRQVRHGKAPHPFVQVDAAPFPGARTFPQVPLGSWASACWQSRLVPPSQHWLVVEQPSVSVAHLDKGVGSKTVRLAECSTFLSSACVGRWRAGQRWAAEQALLHTSVAFVKRDIPLPAVPTHRHWPSMHWYPGLQQSLLASQPKPLSWTHCRGAQ